MTESHPILKSMEEAQAVRSEIVDELAKIRMEMANPNLTDKSGERVSGITYQNWRYSKVKRITELEHRLVYVNKYIHVHSRLPLGHPDRPKPEPSRVKALEVLYRRVKSYIEYQKGTIDQDELDQRWSDIRLAAEEVEKAPQAPSPVAEQPEV